MIFVITLKRIKDFDEIEDFIQAVEYSSEHKILDFQDFISNAIRCKLMVPHTKSDHLRHFIVIQVIFSFVLLQNSSCIQFGIADSFIQVGSLHLVKHFQREAY